MKVNCDFALGFCLGLMIEDHMALLFLGPLCVCFDWRG